LTVSRRVETKVAGTSNLALLPALTDIKDQLAGLVHPGFVTEIGFARLPDVERYLRAIERRLEKLPTTPNKDRELMDQVHQLAAGYDEAVAALPAARRNDEDVRRVRWLLEELRVSYFAQAL